MTAPAPLNLIAELTYRCPLQCPYCSNPLEFRERREALDADDWGRVFEQAAALGVELQTIADRVGHALASCWPRHALGPPDPQDTSDQEPSNPRAIAIHYM